VPVPKTTFDRIRPEKRERVIREAAVLFADRGFSGTDIAEVASRAGVAKGSIYNYFESKDDLYICVCRDGLERHRGAVHGTIDDTWDLYEQIRHIFHAGVAFLEEKPEFMTIYLNIASPGMARFANELSLDVERYTAENLKGTIRRDQKKGLVRKDLDVEVAALLVNSMYIILLASLVSQHHRIRFKEYLDLDEIPDPSSIGRHVDRFIEIVCTVFRPGTPKSPKAKQGRRAVVSG